MNFVALMGSSWPNVDPEKPVSDFMTMDDMVSKVNIRQFPVQHTIC